RTRERGRGRGPDRLAARPRPRRPPPGGRIGHGGRAGPHAIRGAPPPGAPPRGGLSILRCRLATGRTHQIRVHLAARGWPLVGDPAYGEPRWSQVIDPALAAVLRSFPPQALH